MFALRAGITAAAATLVVLGGLVAPAPASAAAEVGTCYAYKSPTLKAVSSTAPAVDCTANHTAETYFVGTLPANFGPPSEASQPAKLAAARPCTVSAMNAYLGMPDRDLPSRFLTVPLFPTDEEWAAGERWMRCDVVLQGGLVLKSFTGTAAALVAATPQEQFNFCTPREPNAKKTAAYPAPSPRRTGSRCSTRSSAARDRSSREPARSSARRASCVRSRARSGTARRSTPDWWAIWPTAIGWKDGKRSAQCFVPYGQYLKEVALQSTPAPAPTPDPAPTAPADVPVEPPAGLSPLRCGTDR